MSYQVDRYVAVRNVFSSIAAISDPAFCNKTGYKENKDSLALCLSVKSDDKQMDYYYLFGDSQVHRYVNDADHRVMSINSEKLQKHILMDIDDFVRGKTVA